MGANQDAIFEASKIGISSNRAMNYSETPENVAAAYRSVANVAKRSRTGDGSTQFLDVERHASAM